MRFVQECSSFGGWKEIEIQSSSGDGAYVVTLPPWDRFESEAVCECPGYEFRGHCRHQREALESLCMWSELDGQPQSAEQQTEQVCPDCGEQTRMVVMDD